MNREKIFVQLIKFLYYTISLEDNSILLLSLIPPDLTSREYSRLFKEWKEYILIFSLTTNLFSVGDPVTCWHLIAKEQV